MATINVRACDVCPASGNERDSLQGAYVHEYAAHERFLHVHEYDERRCDCASVHEPPLGVSGGVHAFQCL